jgi:hypothetical protein
MKLGFPMWHQRISSSQCKGGIVHLPRQSNSSRRFPPGRSCVSTVPCFRTDVAFCSLTSWLKEQQ